MWDGIRNYYYNSVLHVCITRIAKKGTKGGSHSDKHCYVRRESAITLKANSFRYAAESINNLLQDSSAVYAIANCVQNSIDVDSLPGPVKQLLTFPLAPAILSPHLTVPNCPMVYPQWAVKPKWENTSKPPVPTDWASCKYSVDTPNCSSRGVPTAAYHTSACRYAILVTLL